MRDHETGQASAVARIERRKGGKDQGLAAHESQAGQRRKSIQLSAPNQQTMHPISSYKVEEEIVLFSV
jgi:hypothetical protein